MVKQVNLHGDNHACPIQKCHLKHLLEILKTIKYGSVTLFIQDGKVIQIDKNEKLRLR